MDHQEPRAPVVTIIDPLHPAALVEVLPERTGRSRLPASLQVLARRIDYVQGEVRRKCGLGSPREAVDLVAHAVQAGDGEIVLRLTLVNDGVQDVTVSRVLVGGFTVPRASPVVLPGRPLGPTPDDLARTRLTVAAQLPGCPAAEPPLRQPGLVTLLLRGVDGVEEQLVALLGEIATAARAAVAARCKVRVPS